jgi:hypothetical protein
MAISKAIAFNNYVRSDYLNHLMLNLKLLNFSTSRLANDTTYSEQPIATEELSNLAFIAMLAFSSRNFIND